MMVVKSYGIVGIGFGWQFPVPSLADVRKREGAMADADRRAWEQQQRRNRIIDKAESVFFQTGYDGATVPAIADAAGYNKRTLYLYFKDKRELFLAVVLRGLTRLQSALTTAVKRSDADGRRLRHLALAFFDFALAHPEYLDLIMIYESRYFDYLNRQAARQGDGFMEQCQQASDAIARTVTAAIDSGMAAGTIRTELTPQQLMLVLWGQIVGVMKILSMRDNQFQAAFGIDRQGLFEYFVGLVERSLKP
jgi:AcrR family transcriptional regulator